MDIFPLGKRYSAPRETHKTKDFYTQHF